MHDNLPTHQKATGEPVDEWRDEPRGFRCGVPLRGSPHRNKWCRGLARGAPPFFWNRLFRLFFIVLGCAIINTSPLFAEARSEQPYEILLFSSPHCRSCRLVKEDLIPAVSKKYEQRLKIKELDIAQPGDYLKLLELQDRYNWHPKETSTPTIFVDGKFLVGADEIKKYLEIYIDTALSKQGYVPVSLVGSPPDLISRFKLITPLGVITAGLIDGINPCAFTVIILFISFLTLQGYGRLQVLAIGFSFILAVFIIYLLIGIGCFSFLYQLKSYWAVVKITYITGALLCFILAGFSFYDFVKFRCTHKTQDLVLRLPSRLKERIYRIIGLYYRKDKGSAKEPGTLRLIFSAFIVGSFISFFESVCTGQVYLPTIVFVLKTTPLKLRAFSYLLIYNLMFIFPLWLILLFALWGVSSQQFSNFAQRHMGTIKILMVALFLGLGLFLIRQ